MRFEAITLKDIAKALNLSVSTVSKALRNSYEISTETQKLVSAYAEKHNYRPNLAAQGLRKGKSKSIGVIVTNIANNFFSQVIDGIESIAHKKEYNIIISQTHESYEQELSTVQNLAARSIDGLLISLSAETSDTTHFKEINQKGLPIVFFDRVPHDINTHKVICNNYKGAYDATQHLIQQGFKRIAHITSSDSLSITLERLEGYLKALEDNKISFDENLVKYCKPGGMIYEEAFTAITELLSGSEKPDAIFTASDRLSLTTLSILAKLHISVPDQMAIVGFTNTGSADIMNPPLTAVVQPSFEIGQQATELLIKMIEAKRPITEFETKILDVDLQIRLSSLRQ
jgi:LacI family transcriptional regulator